MTPWGNTRAGTKTRKAMQILKDTSIDRAPSFFTFEDFKKGCFRLLGADLAERIDRGIPQSLARSSFCNFGEDRDGNVALCVTEGIHGGRLHFGIGTFPGDSRQ